MYGFEPRGKCLRSLKLIINLSFLKILLTVKPVRQLPGKLSVDYERTNPGVGATDGWPRIALFETATQFPKKRTSYKILALQICCNWEIKLIGPEEFHLTSYVADLNRAIDLGTTNTERAQRKLSEIAADPESFLVKQEDPQALCGELKLSDGSYVLRIPSKTRFLWDGKICATISFSWQGICNSVFKTNTT